jgi:twitching motility protein PilT
MQTPSRQLGEFLVERKVLSREALEAVLARETASGVPFAKILTAESLVAESDVVAAVAAQLGYQFWESDRQPIQPGVERLLPAELARRWSVVPLAVDGSSLMVAMEDPSEQGAITEIEAACGRDVVPVLAVRADVTAALDLLYPVLAEVAAAERTGPTPPADDREIHLFDLLARVIELGASDLHLTVGIPPAVRLDGRIVILEEFPVLNASGIRHLIYTVLTQRQREKFEADLELDTSYSAPDVGRFRVNLFIQRNSVGVVMRAIPYLIKPLADLGLPPALGNLVDLVRGLVLVTGPTGSGKTTTLASMVDSVNASKALHIMTVEDPIEFLHQSKRSIVNQREVGEDTRSFGAALKHALRQDPDVILVGELRDLDTISTALTAAETGHLVFATLHTQDAPQSIDRVIDVFPAHQQQQVRIQLAAALQGVVCQQLVPRKDQPGRAVACEVLVITPAIRNLIRESKTHQIYSAMQAGGRFGMQTMDQSLALLVAKGEIALDTALERCANQDDLLRLAGRK